MLLVFRSTATLLKLWVKPGQFYPSGCSCELPMDDTAFIVALVIPCLDFNGQFFETPDTSVQTFPAQDTQLDLSHVKPASGPWGVVGLQSPG
jgi:hypothetical protein